MCKFNKNMPKRENPDSGSKMGVYCRYTTIMYLAFIIRNLSFTSFENSQYLFSIFISDVNKKISFLKTK